MPQDMQDGIYKKGGDGCNDYMLQWLHADASGPIADNGIPAGGEDSLGFAAPLYNLCLRALQDFYRQERNKRSSRSRSIVLRECLGRLYLWGEPFGVGELDRALEQSDELRNDVVERLVHIGKLLLHELAKSVPLSKAPHQPSKQVEELESAIKQGKLIISGDQHEIPQNGHDSDEEYGSGREGSSDSGSYDIFEDLDFTTTCIMELGPSLEQNLKQAENARVQHSYPTIVPFSVSGPATIYVSLIREKFKKAHYKLVERLGEANWQRHKDVREKMENTEHSLEGTKNLARETGTASSIFRPYSDFHDSGIGTTIPAQTEYAPSHTSFQSSNSEGERNSPRVPREPPEVGARKRFQCFLCRRIISNVKNRVDWKMHVFADLQPYICTFSDCGDELAQFTTRVAWADHEFTEHRNDRAWKCLECSKRFTSASDWEQHLQEFHRRVFSGLQLHVAKNTAYQIQPRPIATEECPLCRIIVGKSRRAFVKHVGRHMEEIALMALPRNTEEDSSDGSISTEKISVGLEKYEMLAAETGLEAREDMSSHQTEYGATSLTTNQPGVADQELEAARLNREWDHSQKDDIEDEDEEVTRCICGNQEYPGLPVSSGEPSKGGAKVYSDPTAFREDATGWYIQCDSCNVWQHGGCVGIMDESTCPEEYTCEQCCPGLHDIRTTVKGRKYSLYLPVHQSQKMASKQKSTPVCVLGSKTSVDSVDLAHNDTTSAPLNRDGNDETPLARACKFGSIEEAEKCLKECPTNINVPDYAGNTPLQTAALEGRTEIVQLLLTAGCDISCENMIRDTPLVGAVENGHLEVAKMLLRAGCNPKQTDSRGKTILGLINTSHDNADKMREALEASLAHIGPDVENKVGGYIIKCICGFPEDAGNTVYCDPCDTWQHTQCYYTDKDGNVPTKEELEDLDHFCADCRPRSLNAKGATERQWTRQKEEYANATGYHGKNPVLTWMQRLQRQIRQNTEDQNSNDEGSLSGGQTSPAHQNDRFASTLNPVSESTYHVSLLEDSMNESEERGQAGHIELPHPSLTRKRHPVYGNSIFSEGQSVYRTGDVNDNFTDFPFEPGTAKGSVVAQPTSGGQDEDGNTDIISDSILPKNAIGGLPRPFQA